MARGQLLYRDVWEQRPPGIYWVYQAAFELLGWRTATVAWLDLIAVTATVVCLYWTVRLVARPLTAATAAALYTILTMPAWLYGHGGFLERAVSETFIAALVCAMAVCAASYVRRPSLPAAVGFGLCAGGTLIFKPNAGLYVPVLALWTVLELRRNGAAVRGPLVRAAVAIAASALVMPGAAMAWLWRHGLLHDAKVAVVDFNRYYVGEGFDLAAYALAFGRAVWGRIESDPLWLLGALGALAAGVTLARDRTLPRAAGLAVLWGAAVVCVIVVNGARLYNSYFIQAGPPLALLGAWLLCDWPGASTRRRAASWAAVAVACGLLVHRDFVGRIGGSAAADMAVLTGRMSETSYLERFGGYGNGRGYSARAHAELASYIRARTDPDERVFVFGINGAGLYFDADRRTAHRFLRVNFFVATDFPHPDFRLEAVVDDLMSAPPRYLIFERLHRTSDARVAELVDRLPADPVLQPLLARYEFEVQIEDFSVYRRRD